MVMLERFTVKLDKYLSYAYTICKCHDQKYDLVNEMFLRVHQILTNEPSKEISDGYIYLILKSIFIDEIRFRSEFNVEDDFFARLESHDQENTDKRKTISNTLDQLTFLDREILMQCQEKSFREIGRTYGMHHTTVSKMYDESKKQFKKKWENNE